MIQERMNSMTEKEFIEKRGIIIPGKQTARGYHIEFETPEELVNAYLTLDNFPDLTSQQDKFKLDEDELNIEFASNDGFYIIVHSDIIARVFDLWVIRVKVEA